MQEANIDKIQIKYAALIGELLGTLNATKLTVDLNQYQINNINEKIKVLQNISVLHIAD